MIKASEDECFGCPGFRVFMMLVCRSSPALLSQWVTLRAVFFCLFSGVLVQPLTAEQSIGLYIREYRIEGAKRLKNLEVEEAVYPFLGPGRTPEDVEQARLALEKVYHDKGYQTVSVVVPQQDPRRGVIRMEVVEGRVGRLRVNGARFYLPSRIKGEVPSLAEGKVPDMNQVTREIIGVNRLADRRVTPVLRAGVVPGTVDIDLNVEDKLPLHGSLEVNNRYSANTTPTRINGSLSYANFFQKGHTGGLSFQIAPENTDDARVFSGYYLARVSDACSLMLQGTKQDSNISTLSSTVGGKGNIIGLRAIYDLPTTPKFYQSFSLGIDYKSFKEDIVYGPTTISSPIEYYPLSMNYGASWLRDRSFTEWNTSLNFHLRGMGSDEQAYAKKRTDAGANYVYIRSDLSHTRDINGGSQVYGKIQGQLASQPLVNSEQFAGGGLDSVRGYLEGTQLGDNGIFGTLEYRSPSLIGTPDKTGARSDEWRFHAFADGGMLSIYKPLPSQDQYFRFASVGAGTRFKAFKHYNGSLDVAMPLIDQVDTQAGDVRVIFRGWADF